MKKQILLFLFALASMQLHAAKNTFDTFDLCKNKPLQSNEYKTIQKFILENRENWQDTEDKRENPSDYSPLMYAIDTSNLVLLKCFVVNSANVKKLSHNYISPIELAIMRYLGQKSDQNLEIVSLLLKQDVIVDLINDHVRRFLIDQIKKNNFEMVRMLIKRVANNASGEKVNINFSTDNKEKTALTYAAKHSSIEIVQLLVESGAQVNIENDSIKNSILLQAISFNSVEVIEYLESKGAQLNASFGMTAFHAAATNENVRVIQYFKSKKDVNINATCTVNGYENLTPLHCAVESENIPVIHYLIAEGANINATFTNSKEENERFSLDIAIENQNLTIMKILLQNKSGAREDAGVLINDCFKNEDKKKVANLVVKHWGNINEVLKSKELTEEQTDIIVKIVTDDSEESKVNINLYLAQLTKSFPDKAEKYNASLAKHPSLASLAKHPSLAFSWTKERYAKLAGLSFIIFACDFARFKSPKQIKDTASLAEAESKEKDTPKKTSSKNSSQWEQLKNHTNAYADDLKRNLFRNHKKLFVPILIRLLKQ
ncbi:ankyrin repeat domain-containing protein [Candidatus Babeliales bacterium]|nr:ankyrin repeat domain-containing protein [Candidatus Babeliales bacterium]